MDVQRGLFSVRVSGEYACFTRPEFKAERVSYPIITPSAARGLLEAIMWKPEFRWQIREIRVLSPLRQTAIMRNELGERQGDKPVLIEDIRQQRTSLLLKDVAYGITAQMVLRRHATDPLVKYADQFARRLARGQCHHMPYFGTREFAAAFAPATGDEKPAPLNLGIGSMLFDIAYRPDRTHKELNFYRRDPAGKRELVSGRAHALFFNAEVSDGVLIVPPEKYAELYALEDGHA